jgi:2-polyprenyl-3-methyl-5-hydroxy-6-metoxy-1,4-benzoquinol methylase
VKNCRLCGNNRLAQYYKINENNVLYKCNKCEFVQMSVPETDFLDGIAAEESVSQDVDRLTSKEDMKLNKQIGYTGSMSRMNHVLKVDSARINKTIKEIVNKTFGSFDEISFIDVGSGYGYHSFNLKKELPEIDVHLLEISSKRMKTGINTFNPNLNDFTFHHTTLNDDFAYEYYEKFDISFSFHVLEHVYDIKEFIRNMFAITKKGGTMVLEVPNEDDDLCKLSKNYKKIIHFPSHVSCFTKKTLTKLVEESGIVDEVELNFIPIQRYGYFNYVDWVRFNEKEKVFSDDYVPRVNRSWIEENWLQTKEENFTTDSIAIVIKKL